MSQKKTNLLGKKLFPASSLNKQEIKVLNFQKKTLVRRVQNHKQVMQII